MEYTIITDQKGTIELRHEWLNEFYPDTIEGRKELMRDIKGLEKDEEKVNGGPVAIKKYGQCTICLGHYWSNPSYSKPICKPCLGGLKDNSGVGQ